MIQRKILWPLTAFLKKQKKKKGGDLNLDDWERSCLWIGISQNKKEHRHF
jgi:hypothetical protein